MKRLHYLVSMLTVLSFGACQNEDDFSQRFDSSEVVVSATLETESNSRTSLESEKVYWEENDALSVFLGNTTMQNATIIKETMEDTYAQFKITAGSDVILGGGTEDDQNYFANVAYYPYGEDVSVEKDGNNYVVSAVLPETQNFKNNSFGTNAYPMIAVTDGLNFGFKNIAGLIHIPLKGTATIVKVTVSSQSHKLAGKYKVTASADFTPTMEMESDAVSLVTLDCGEGVTLSESEAFGFDFVLPVGEYEGNDLTFTFYDNNNGYMEFVAANADKVVRSKRTMFSEKTYEVTGYDLSEDVVAWIGKETYTSISSAVEASQANDVINVKPGTHNEIVDVKGGKNVTIQPANKGDEVTIAGIAHESNGTPSTIVVKNITLDNTLQTEGWFTGTGNNLKPCVGAWGGNFTFEGCKFIVEGTSGKETGVLTWWIVNKMSLTFNDCTFEGKDNHTSARAMQIYGNADLTVTNCTFNTYKDYSLKYVATEGNVATFEGNKVYNSKYLVQLGSAPYAGSKYAVNIDNTTLGEGVSHYYIDHDEDQMVYIDGVCSVSTSKQLAYVVSQGVTNIKLADGTYQMPDEAKGKTLTISGTNAAIIEVVPAGQGEANGQLDYSLDGSTVTFNGVTIKTNSQLYAGYARLSAVYNDCVIQNTYNLGIGTSEFNGCTFNITNEYLRVGGANSAKFEGCTFNTDGRAILIFQDGTSVAQSVTVKDCIFNATAAATTWNGIHVAAVSIDGTNGSYTVNLEGENTVDSNFNGLWQIKAGETNVTVNETVNE